jgi:pilus assembly protein CpaB
MAARGRRSGTIFIVLALILVIVLGAVAYVFRDLLFPAPAPVVTNNLPTPAPAVQTVDIVVLTQNVSFGQIIPDGALGFAPIPADRYVEGLYFKTKDQVKGRRSRYQLQSGTILSTGMLSEGAIGSYVSSQIPPGYVAISVPISDITAVSYALQPGDHVSVLVSLLLTELDPNFQSKLPNNTAKVESPGPRTTAAPGVSTIGITGGGAVSAQGRTELDPILNQPVYVQASEPQRPRIVTQMLVSDAMVLGVGLFPLSGGPVTAATAAPTPVPGQPTPTPSPAAAAAVPTGPTQVSLVVTPQDAVAINYVLMNQGAKINLALRSAGDSKVVKTESVTLQFLMDQYNVPFPSKLPYGLEPRTDNLDSISRSPVLTPAPQLAPIPTSAPAK